MFTEIVMFQWRSWYQLLSELPRSQETGECSQDLPGYGSIGISSLNQPFKPLGWGVGKSLTLICWRQIFNQKAAEVKLFLIKKIINYLSAVETMSGDCRGRRCRSRYVLAAGSYKAIQYQDQALRGVNLSMWTLLSTNGSNTLEKPDYGFLWFQFATMINGQNMIKEMLANIYEEINLVKPVWSNRQYVVILPGLACLPRQQGRFWC